MREIIHKYFKGDKVIWVLSILLALISIIAVYSSIVNLAYKYYDGNTTRFLLKHSLVIISGFVLMFYAHKVKYTYYSRLSQICIVLAVILLFVTFLFGVSINKASRWLEIPFIEQNFQTSDFAKIALIMYVSRLLAKNKDKLNDFKQGVLPILIPIGIICGLILPANFSTAAVLFVTMLVLLFVGKVYFKYILSVVGSAIAGLMLMISISFITPELLPRINTWKERIVSYEDNDEEYQVERAKMAIANGKLFGKGPAQGVSRNLLPYPYSDMIYAFIIEEYGSILGGLGILLLYLILMFRAVRIASKCEKNFGSYLTIGLSFSLVFQAMINIGVAVNIFPVTGQPLPLVSMGGTSIWFSCISLGMILSVSKEQEEEDNHNSDSDV